MPSKCSMIQLHFKCKICLHSFLNIVDARFDLWCQQKHWCYMFIVVQVFVMTGSNVSSSENPQLGTKNTSINLDLVEISENNNGMFVISFSLSIYSIYTHIQDKTTWSTNIEHPTRSYLFFLFTFIMYLFNFTVISGSAAVAFISYTNMTNIVKPTLFNTITSTVKTMMSTVVSVSLPKTTNRTLTKPINITFKHINVS